MPQYEVDLEVTATIKRITVDAPDKKEAGRLARYLVDYVYDVTELEIEGMSVVSVERAVEI